LRGAHLAPLDGPAVRLVDVVDDRQRALDALAVRVVLVGSVVAYQADGLGDLLGLLGQDRGGRAAGAILISTLRSVAAARSRGYLAAFARPPAEGSARPSCMPAEQLAVKGGSAATPAGSSGRGTPSGVGTSTLASPGNCPGVPSDRAALQGRPRTALRARPTSRRTSVIRAEGAQVDLPKDVVVLVVQRAPARANRVPLDRGASRPTNVESTAGSVSSGSSAQATPGRG
jgi:hypothetical protein